MIIAFSRRLADIGVDTKYARSILEDNQWNYEKAIKYLMAKYNLKKDVLKQKPKMHSKDAFDEKVLFYLKSKD